MSPLVSPTVLILKTNRLVAETIHGAVRRVFSSVRCFAATSGVEADEIISLHAVDVIVTGVALRDQSALDFIPRALRRHGATRILVVTARKEHHILDSLRRIGVQGVFDPDAEDVLSLERAVRAVSQGQGYWSRSSFEALHDESPSARAVQRRLTSTERLVLSVLGDGCDDEEAARILNSTPGAILSMRRKLHRKLNLKQKGELMRIAGQLGLVWLSASGVQRPGHTLLLNS